jgi:hypothetical protein
VIIIRGRRKGRRRRRRRRKSRRRRRKSRRSRRRYTVEIPRVFVGNGKFLYSYFDSPEFEPQPGNRLL